MFGEVTIVDDVPQAFAGVVSKAFEQRTEETFAMALSGGDTARRCYEVLAEQQEIDWWDVDFYWGDERCVEHSDPASNYRLGRESLLERIGAANSVYPMNCIEGPQIYQMRVADAGRLDLVHLGLGKDGHTASLFPQSAALEVDPGDLVVLNEDPLGNNPYPRMTLTFSAIARARLTVFTVEGEQKAEAFKAVTSGMDLPAARVRSERVVWLVDRKAAHWA